MFAATPWATIGAWVIDSCSWLATIGWRHRLLQQVDLPRRLVRHPEGADLAGRLELVEGAGDLVRLDQGVRAVQQQDVEVVGLQRRAATPRPS